MKLDDLIVDITDIIRNRPIKVIIKIGDGGISIKPENTEERLTLAELTSLSAMAFFYVGFANAEFMSDKEDVVRRGMQLYGTLKRGLRGDYDSKK